jgi:hypothetical protein
VARDTIETASTLPSLYEWRHISERPNSLTLRGVLNPLITDICYLLPCSTSAATGYVCPDSGEADALWGHAVARLIGDSRFRPFIIGEKREGTFGSLPVLADWVAGLRLAPSTVASYWKNVRLHIVPRIGQVPPSSLTTAQIDALHRELERRAGRPQGRDGAAGQNPPSAGNPAMARRKPRRGRGLSPSATPACASAGASTHAGAPGTSALGSEGA